MFRPTQFGKYFLTERIAVGGMAELFKAKLFGVSGFEKPMVVKQILPKYSKNEDFIKMFVDEAKICVTLTHGNIVPVYELGRLNGIYFIAMEYVHGKDLADILDTARTQNKPLTPEHAVLIAVEVCKGLDYAHRRTDAHGNSLRVVHRDVSPPNILISLDGEVKIADFGIAKAAHKLGTTEAGVVKGTFGYMSPEQVRGLPLDHRTDIFSAGILLHEMLTGRRLFAGESELEAIERVKSAKVPAPSAVNPRVPSALDPIVFKALAKDPADRFADANTFHLALSRFLFTAGGGATASTLSRYMHELFEESLRRDREATPVPALWDASHPSTEGFCPEEVTHPERPGSGRRRPDQTPPRVEDSQVFAVRSEISALSPATPDVARTPAPPRSRPAMDAGAGGRVAINETLALPSLSDVPAPPEVPADPEDEPEIETGEEPEEEFDEERTQVFKGGRSPKRPQVPELRFPPSVERAARGLTEKGSAALQIEEKRRSDVEVGTPSHALPSTAEFGAMADAFGPLEALAGKALPEPVPAPPAVEPQPVPSAAPPSSRPVTAGSGLLALLAGSSSAPESSGDRPALAEVAADGPSAEAAAPPAPNPDGARRPTAPPRGPAAGTGNVSGILSATMRLFVVGLEEEAAPPPTEGSTAAPLPVRPGSDTDELPRTVKPTILGWLIIVALVAGAGAFVLYKKTSLFGKGETDEGDVLRPEALKKPVVEATAQKGSILLFSKPEGARFFFFVGETPAAVPDLDVGEAHLLRIEREGYQAAYKLLEPNTLTPEGTEVKVTLNPVGAGAKEDMTMPATTGTPAGRRGSVRVQSEPPMAMIWLLVGQSGRAEMKDLDTSKTYNFKAVLPGYQQVLVNVASVDFDKVSGIYRTTVNLEQDAAVDAAPSAMPDARPAATPEPAHPRGAPRPELQPQVKVKPDVQPEPKKALPGPRPKAQPAHVPAKRPKKPKKASTKPEPVTKPDTKPPAKKDHVPDWAR
jgi:serine/threonine protein kinase